MMDPFLAMMQPQKTQISLHICEDWSKPWPSTCVLMSIGCLCRMKYWPYTLMRGNERSFFCNPAHFVFASYKIIYKNMTLHMIKSSCSTVFSFFPILNYTEHEKQSIKNITVLTVTLVGILLLISWIDLCSPEISMEKFVTLGVELFKQQNQIHFCFKTVYYGHTCI